jgi:hypothetical protein
MRITVIKDDKSIGIDGKFYLEIQQDWSWFPEDIHAFQWYDTWGEIEYTDKRANERVEELGIFENAVIMYNVEYEKEENAKIEAENSRDYWEEFREYRFFRLRETDWTQALDSPLDEIKKEEYRIYRQELRDLTENITDPKPLVLDPNHPDWPIKPE